jgi:hypothetical protein
MASIVNLADKRPAFDVALVVNLHRARPYLARTMLSIEEAVLFAQAEGVRIQLVLVLDRPDGSTSDWIGRYDCAAFDGHEIITVDYGSLGPARNDGLRAARGEFVMLLDDDDLISFNLIVECLRIARKEGPRCIVIPQYVVNFGPGSQLAKYSGSDDISPLALISDHPYVSRIFAHSSIRDALLFADVPRGGAYAFEDWHFNATAYALGYRFRIARDTILFYRLRSDGLSRLARIESLNQIPPSPLFEPRTFLRLYRDSDFSRPAHEPLPFDEHQIRREFLDSPVLRELVEAARRIEPAISLDDAMPAWSNAAGGLRLGAAYVRACEIVQNSRFSHVVLLDSSVTWQDLRYLADVFGFLESQEARFGLLLLSPSPLQHKQSLSDHVVAVTGADLGDSATTPSTEDFQLIALRLIGAVAADAHVHMMPGRFPHEFFARYRRALSRHRKYYYRFEQGSGSVPDSAVFQFVSDFIDELDLAIYRSDAVLERDRTRIDRGAHKWRLLRPRSHPPAARSAALAPPSRRLLYRRGDPASAGADLLFLVARHLGLSVPDVLLDVMLDDYPDAARLDRVSLLPNLRIVPSSAIVDDTQLYDAVIVQDHGYPGWQHESYPVPMVVLQASAEAPDAIAEQDGRLCIREPSSERAAAAVARTIRRFYSDAAWSTQLRQAAVAYVQDRHGPRSFATMAARALQ